MLQTMKFLSIVLVIISGLSVCLGIDQWRGPNRDGHYPETGLLKQWPKDGPPLKWYVEGIGAGWGSPTASNDKVFVVGTHNKQDHLVAVDRQGKILWKTAYGSNWKKSFPESRCAPTIEDDRVYVTSGLGQVTCIHAQTGDMIWSLDAVSKFQGKQGPWGISESLLIVDDKVIFTPGGDQTTMVALNKKNGDTIWQSESLKDQSAYASPILIEHGGKQVIVNVTGEYVIGVDSVNGKLLWKYHYFALETCEHHLAPYINTNSPIYANGHLFITSGYDHTSIMLKIADDNSKVDLIWKQPLLDTHHGGVVLVNGTLYGSNWLNNQNGNWMAVDWKSGQIRYEKKWENKGSIIYADGMFYCYIEKTGSVLLGKPSVSDFEVISSFTITKGEKQHWAHPSIYNKTLYIRHGDVLMAYDIADKKVVM